MAIAPTDPYQLTDRFVATDGTVFLSGTQALARLPFDQLRADRAAGHRTAALVTGYPGSPLGGYDGAVASVAALHPDLPVSCRPALNEEYAATALLGSQLANSQPDARYDGVLGIWYGKAPGVDRATDALRHGVYAGTTPLGGVVALIGDDPVAKSSTVPSSSVGILQDLHIPVLYPSDPAAALELGRHAIALTRYSGLWSALKIVSDVADGTAAVDLDRLGPAPIFPSEPDPARRADGRLLTPHTLDIEREIYEVRYELARHYASVNRLNTVAVQSPTAWIGLIASGITYGEVRAALAQLGLRGDDEVAEAGIRILNMRMPLPFDPSVVRDFASGLDEILVIEEKQPHLEQLVMSALYGSTHRPLITGKHDDQGRLLVPGHGGLDADGILPVLRRRLAARLADRLVPERPTRELIPVTEAARTPYYCSGCPHNRSTETPDGSLVGAGIGCHTMVLMMEPERVGTVMALTPMGNEGTQWIGMSDFVDTDHFIQNLGDGTYFHSGQLAVTAAIAAGVNITYKLLYNGAVAMTGGQLPQGQRSVADVVEVLRHQGVAEIIVTTDAPGDLRDLRGSVLHRARRVKVWDRTRVVEAQEHLATVPGVTVLIHVQPCAAELRRTRKRGLTPTPSQRVTINQRVCEGCGDCGRVSNCLSVQPIDTPFGRKTAIDQSTCNLDFSCLDGDCPSFITVDTDAPRWRRALERVLRRPTAEAGERVTAVDSPTSIEPTSIDQVLAAPLPAPEIHVPTDDFAVRIAGIGGTGVVTVAQIIGTAAMLDGFRVRGLDQVGLSQKAGPVVSDLLLSIEQPASNRVGVGEADLLLVLDQLVGSLPKTLATASERTVVVGSTTVTPTGREVRHPDLEGPTPAALAAEIAAASAPTDQHWADFTAVANDAFGSSTTANIIGVGMAVQLGVLPISPERIEEAISLNGTAVALNLRGFRLGRQLAHRAPAVHAALAATPTDTRSSSPLPVALTSRIEELDPGIRPDVERYATDLIGFQDLQLAERYVASVARIAEAERTIDPGASKLTTAVAENLHRVMAYKDEYEVARLILDPAGRAEAERIAGTSGVIRYRLHPPLLRDHGLDRKIALGAWADPMFRALARGKRLRGSRLDPFGRTIVRREERRFAGEYAQVVEMILDNLSADSYDVAVEIAALPESVRGYESLKLERLAEFRTRLDGLLPRLIDKNRSSSTILR